MCLDNVVMFIIGQSKLDDESNDGNDENESGHGRR